MSALIGCQDTASETQAASETQGLHAGELLRGGLAGSNQHRHRRGRDLARGERVRHHRHLTQRAGQAHLRRRGRVGDAVPIGHPGGHRQVPVGPERPSPLELGQATGPLGLQDPAGTLELVEVACQLVVARQPKVLGPQLVQRRSKRAHDRDATGVPFDVP
jgi:hypothetical protein